jgi:hypothetical protein
MKPHAMFGSDVRSGMESAAWSVRVSRERRQRGMERVRAARGRSAAWSVRVSRERRERGMERARAARANAVGHGACSETEGSAWSACVQREGTQCGIECVRSARGKAAHGARAFSVRERSAAWSVCVQREGTQCGMVCVRSARECCACSVCVLREGTQRGMQAKGGRMERVPQGGAEGVRSTMSGASIANATRHAAEV